MAVVGEAASPDLSREQSDLLEKLVEGGRDAYAKGQLSEQQIGGLIKLAALRAPYSQWKPELANLPDALAGPLAYVLGRHAQINLQRPQEAKPFFQDALRIAPKLDPASPLSTLANAELR
jgi:hypothetical protein